ELRRRRVGQGGVRPLRPGLRRGRRGQRRAAAEARDGQPGPVRQGLDDRREVLQQGRLGSALDGPTIRGVPGAGGALMPSRYIANTSDEQKRMLGVIGAAPLEELLVRTPAKARLSRPLGLPSAMA